jgi:hypothetical protein
MLRRTTFILPRPTFVGTPPKDALRFILLKKFQNTSACRGYRSAPDWLLHV